jgi:DNA-binding GntR family transcriptional regulator
VREDQSLKSVLQDLSLTQKKTLSEEVLDRVREAIVSGRFRPGDGLSESMLATAFGVSRGPVREALSQLQQEGLVVIERYRGAKVTRISQEDVEELYELRTDLERFAIKRAARLISAEELEKMGSIASAYREAVEGGAVQEAVDLDMQFHDLIYRAGQHTRLYSCWSTLLRSQIHAWILSCSFVDPSYMIPCVMEHQAIHDALEARDRDRAVELIERHLGDAYERLTQIPFEDK